MRKRFIWVCSLLLAFVWLFSGVRATFAEPAKQKLEYTPDALIVKLDSGVDAFAFALSAGLRTNPASIKPLSLSSIYRFEIADGMRPPVKAKQLERDARVLYAEPEYIGQMPEAKLRSTWVVGGDTHEYVAQWAADKMHLPEAHAVSLGAGVTVAILDTGIDATHPALASHLVPGYDFMDNDADPSETLPVDAALRTDPNAAVSVYGHGTHVAGLVALAAPDAKIMPLRTLDANGVGTIWTQAEALVFAIKNGASVINLSYSFDQPSKMLNDVMASISCTGPGRWCETTTRPGVVIVAAAGNSASSQGEYPAAASLPGLLAVGATTEQDTWASFSNYGSWVTVGAPGDHILSTVPGGGYATWSGTSMAAPLAAGTVALLRAAKATLRPSEVVTWMKVTSVKIDSSKERRVDAASTINALAYR